jgi:hypothetical protein
MTEGIPDYLRGDSRTKLLIEAMERIEDKVRTYQEKTITWYTDDVGDHANPDDVTDPRQGDMFLFTESGDLFQYNAGEWRFLATLNTARPG